MEEAVTKILGEEPKKELITHIQDEVNLLYDHDLKLHHFHLHNYISHQELTLHVMMDGDSPIKQGHDIATHIEEMIKEKFKIEATIHIEPLE